MIFKKRFTKTLSAVATVSQVDGQNVIHVEWDGNRHHVVMDQYQKWMRFIFKRVAESVNAKILCVLDMREGFPPEPPVPIRPFDALRN